jgi:hypothetical protein
MTKPKITTDSNAWTYLFSIIKGNREAEIYISNGLDEKFRVVCKVNGDPREAVEDNEMDYCREVAEDYVMSRR